MKALRALSTLAAIGAFLVTAAVATHAHADCSNWLNANVTPKGLDVIVAKGSTLKIAVEDNGQRLRLQNRSNGFFKVALANAATSREKYHTFVRPNEVTSVRARVIAGKENPNTPIAITVKWCSDGGE